MISLVGEESTNESFPFHQYEGALRIKGVIGDKCYCVIRRVLLGLYREIGAQLLAAEYLHGFCNSRGVIMKCYCDAGAIIGEQV